MKVQDLVFVSWGIGVIILLPTLGVIGLGVFFYFEACAFEHRSVSCLGKVVALQSSQGENGTTLYTPSFTYTDAAGVVRQGRSNSATNPPAYAIGGPISLRYDPKNPSDVRVDSFWSIWLGPMICTLLTIPFLLFASIFLFLVPFAIRRVWREPGKPAVHGMERVV